MLVDDPAVLAEVTAAFIAYEAALKAYDVERLDGFFWQDPRALRYGIADMQTGAEAIAAYRRTLAGIPDRRLVGTRITCFGRDFAVANTMFINLNPDGTEDGRRIGRQSQTWVRTEAGWRIAAAHVSMIDADLAPGRP